MALNESLGVVIIVLASTSPIFILALVYYLKKRLDHALIAKAVETGTPLSALIPPAISPAGPAWTKYISIGVALLVVVPAILYARHAETIAACIVAGPGLGLILRGLLDRTYYQKAIA